MRFVALGAVLALLVGCNGPVQQGELAPNYLRLQGYTIVDADAGTLQGFLRWIYVADDPAEFEETRTDCEVWEYLDLLAVDVPDSCVGCTDVFEGTAAVEDGPDTTCTDVGWASRDFALSFGALDGIEEPERADLEADGFTHEVRTRWSPDVGSSEGFQALFAAEPQQWAPDDGVAGNPVDVSGEYALFCRYYWDVRDADTP